MGNLSLCGSNYWPCLRIRTASDAALGDGVTGELRGGW